jgi:2,4-dienoyl-CoA reductase-like NADH-dependent reductase (Old Yellow Enzyme family)
MREGEFGGSFDNRTRFLREVVQGIRADAPRLLIGVRLSAFDTVPFHRDTTMKGVPETGANLLPYRWGFGVNTENPTEPDLREPIEFMRLLSELGVNLVNISAGSPYYNPHVQRPALYPPSDGYLAPEDPLQGVARQMGVTRTLKQRFPEMIIVGSAYSYLQEFLPHVAHGAVREGWTDCVGLGRMILTYPSLPLEVIDGHKLLRKRICRTFSDCTTAPRAGLPSGCYPLDPHYKQSENAVRLKEVKAHKDTQ